MTKKSAWMGVMALAACSGIARGAYNTWTTHGPEGGQITALAVDPTHPATVFAGTAFAGVFKSEDGGKDWTLVSTGLTDLHVHALVIDPKNAANIYAGTLEGVFRTTNGARTGPRSTPD
jgi:hypothetical protein